MSLWLQQEWKEQIHQNNQLKVHPDLPQGGMVQLDVSIGNFPMLMRGASKLEILGRDRLIEDEINKPDAVKILVSVINKQTALQTYYITKHGVAQMNGNTIVPTKKSFNNNVILLGNLRIKTLNQTYYGYDIFVPSTKISPIQCLIDISSIFNIMSEDEVMICHYLSRVEVVVPPHIIKLVFRFVRSEGIYIKDTSSEEQKQLTKVSLTLECSKLTPDNPITMMKEGYVYCFADQLQYKVIGISDDPWDSLNQCQLKEVMKTEMGVYFEEDRWECILFYLLRTTYMNTLFYASREPNGTYPDICKTLTKFSNQEFNEQAKFSTYYDFKQQVSFLDIDNIHYSLSSLRLQKNWENNNQTFGYSQILLIADQPDYNRFPFYKDEFLIGKNPNISRCQSVIYFSPKLPIGSQWHIFDGIGDKPSRNGTFRLLQPWVQEKYYEQSTFVVGQEQFSLKVLGTTNNYSLKKLNTVISEKMK